MACDEELICHRDALSNELWMKAMQVEWTPFMKMTHGSVVTCLQEHVVTKWVYKVKRKVDGSVD